MFYTIYVTEHLTSGKRYIGKHITENPNDSYLGSGLRLNNAIKKHGITSFKKTVLFVFDNEEEMCSKEIELITIDVTKDINYYNIALGGNGGCIVLRKDHPLYESTSKRISEAQLARSADMSRITTENHKLKRVGMYGKKQTDKQKKAVSDSQSGRKKSKESIERQKLSLAITFESEGYVHPNKGREHTASFKKASRERTLSRPKKKCPNCSVFMDERNYARYHGIKCKSLVKRMDSGIY